MSAHYSFTLIVKLTTIFDIYALILVVYPFICVIFNDFCSRYSPTPYSNEAGTAPWWPDRTVKSATDNDHKLCNTRHWSIDRNPNI